MQAQGESYEGSAVEYDFDAKITDYQDDVYTTAITSSYRIVEDLRPASDEADFSVTAATSTSRLRAEMLDSIESYKLRWLALLLAEKPESLSSPTRLEEPSLERPLIVEVSGLTHAHIASRHFISMPAIKTPRAVKLVEKELLSIADLSPFGTTWIVDMSAVEHLPIMILGALTAYKETFSIKNVLLLWLRESAIPPSISCSVIERFSCQLHGRQYFSTLLPRP
jgi:hypothetical protein